MLNLDSEFIGGRHRENDKMSRSSLDSATICVCAGFAAAFAKIDSKGGIEV